MMPRSAILVQVVCFLGHILWDNVDRGPKFSIFSLTLKGPGFFVYLKSGGGGGGRIPPPPSDLGRGATKNSEIWHVRRVHQYARADKIAMLKIKQFLIMQIYVKLYACSLIFHYNW